LEFVKYPLVFSILNPIQKESILIQKEKMTKLLIISKQFRIKAIKNKKFTTKIHKKN